jgi:cell division protease FtsH
MNNEKTISDTAQEKIDTKVKDILDNAYNIAINLIKKNKKLHEQISKDLIKNEELSKKEFASYFIKKT